MGIRGDLKAYLSSVPALTALIGTSPARVAWSKIPSNWKVYPAIVFRLRTGAHESDLDGGAGYASGTFDFATVGLDPTAVENTSDQLRIAMLGIQNTTLGNTFINEISLDDESDDYIDDTLGDDGGYFTIHLPFTISWRESVPTFSYPLA